MTEYFSGFARTCAEANALKNETHTGDIEGCRRSEANASAKEEDHLLPHRNSVFLRDFQKNKVRLRELKRKHANSEASAIELSCTAKRVKKGDKDRMLCMVADCKKHVQTMCDGCCLAHFRIISSTPFKNDKKASHSQTSTSAKALDGPKSASSNLLGTPKGRKIGVQTHMKHSSILSKLQVGSRIYVKWDGDNKIYKATVKKILVGRELPDTVKIHYDGKKRHIVNTIPLEMVEGFIKGENPARKAKPARKDAPPLTKRQTTQTKNLINFAALQTLYSCNIPPGKNEIAQLCPELGAGWHVYTALRKGDINGTHNDQFFVSPTGKKFRSPSELEKYYLLHPSEFGKLRGKVNCARKPTRTVVSESHKAKHLDDKCREVSAINRDRPPVQLDSGPFLSTNRRNFSLVKRPASSYSPPSSEAVGGRSLITISSITANQFDKKQKRDTANSLVGANRDRGHSICLSEQNMCRGDSTSLSQDSRIPSLKPKPSTSAPLNFQKPPGDEALQSPKEVTALKFASSSHVDCHQISNLGYLTRTRRTSAALLQRKNGVHVSDASSLNVANKEEIGSTRPRRTLKPVTRFEEEGSPTSLRLIAPEHSKSVLCHCPDCNKGNLSVQGMYAHYGRAHSGTLSWQLVTFSCPFCTSIESPIFKSFNEVETHVNTCHTGCNVLGPHPLKLANGSTGVKSITPRREPKPRQDFMLTSERVLRERKPMTHTVDYATKASRVEASEIVAHKRDLPSWTKIEYMQLLPDGRTEYSRDMGRIITMIDEQCQTQEEILKVAQEQRRKLCRNEAESENRALAEERLLYQRGIRDRMRMADGERIEKQKYIEKSEHMMIHYNYENRNKRRKQEDLDVKKLCSRPIRFVNGTTRQNTKQGKACKDEECQFCTKENGYLRHLLLDNEMSDFNMDAPATSSPVFQQCTQVLNPSFCIINDEYFSKAEASECLKNDRKEDCGKRVNQCRRDASTAKRLKLEEDKLLMLKNTKHSLEFINRYNNGLITHIE